VGFHQFKTPPERLKHCNARFETLGCYPIASGFAGVKVPLDRNILDDIHPGRRWPVANEYPPLKIRVLGSGTSMGVPVVGCHCAVCTSEDPHNQRLRSSVSIQAGNSHLLVDCSIDFRQQMLTWPMPRIDAVLLTHTHSDHVNGLDDLRSYNYIQRSEIPIYTTQYFIEDLLTRFNYCLNPLQKGGGVPRLNLVEVKPGRPFTCAGVEVLPVEILHGKLPILGFRLGPFAYMTDCSGIPETSEALLKDLEVVIISALRHTPHTTHFNLKQSLVACRRLGVKRAYFTHIADELDHETTNRNLPDWARLAHDGLLIELP
jgi:phosphoribosyl 1,2-cyclic phosphate phosphodiesterase